MDQGCKFLDNLEQRDSEFIYIIFRPRGIFVVAGSINIFVHSRSYTSLSQRVAVPTPFIAFLPFRIFYAVVGAILRISPYHIFNDLVTFTPVTSRIFSSEKEQICYCGDKTDADIHQH